MKRSVLVAAMIVLGATTVVADQALIEQSHALMKANGKNLGGVLSPMAKGDKPYDQAAINAALTQLDETAKKLPSLYPASVKAVSKRANILRPQKSGTTGLDLMLLSQLSARP